MTSFLLYLLKSTLLLAVFDAFFLLVMRRSSHFRFNRAVLLTGSAGCLLLPLLPIRVGMPTLYSEWLAPAVVSGAVSTEAAQAMAEAVQTAAASAATPSLTAILLALYMTGAAITLGFYVRSYAGMFRLLRRTPGEPSDGCTLHRVAQETPSFSWMRHIVVSQSDCARYPAILTHERAHVHCGHSRDLLLSSILTVFQWFNPLVWICRTELKLLHEYEADDCVLNQGIDATQYQLLLVKKAVGEKRFLLANGFNHAQLKSRISMMQAPRQSAWKKLFLLLLLPLLAGVTVLLAERTAVEVAPDAEVPAAEVQEVVQPEAPAAPLPAPEAKAPATAPDDEEEIIPFRLVETKPKFQDGDASQFSRWVNAHLRYPAEAYDHRIQGRVTLQFAVDTDGSVTDVKVLRSPDASLSEAAMQVVSQSPKWIPGTQRGKPVKVVYNFPVVFQLK